MCDATTHHWEFRVFALGWSLLCRLGIHDTLCGWFARLTKAQPQPGSLLAGTDSEQAPLGVKLLLARLAHYIIGSCK